MLDPKNLCLDTKINLLGELVTEIQALTAILAAIFNLCKYLKMLNRYRVASSRFEISGYELYKRCHKMLCTPKCKVQWISSRLNT